MVEKVYSGYAMAYFNEQVPVRTILEKVEVIRTHNMEPVAFFDGFGIVVVQNAAGGSVTAEQLSKLREMPEVVSVERSRQV